MICFSVRLSLLVISMKSSHHPFAGSRIFFWWSLFILNCLSLHNFHSKLYSQFATIVSIIQSTRSFSKYATNLSYLSISCAYLGTVYKPCFTSAHMNILISFVICIILYSTTNLNLSKSCCVNHSRKFVHPTGILRMTLYFVEDNNE